MTHHQSEPAAQLPQDGPPDPPPPDVLELRIHGIRNTPPHEMLACPAEEAVLVTEEGVPQGDRLAGFYEHAAPAGEAAPPAAPDAVPTRVEAYSWGNLARTAPDLGFLQVAGRTVSNLGWLLLVPFGLANAAYWARPVRRRPGPRGQEPFDMAAGSPAEADQLRAGPGAGVVRLFALLLTLLSTTSFATVALDLVAAQCFDAGTRVCSALPGIVDPLASWTRGQRLAILAAVPILAVVLLVALSVVGNVRYQRVVAFARLTAQPLSDGQGAAQSAPERVLAAPNFWKRAFVASPTGLVHLGASLALLAVLLCSDQLAPLVPEQPVEIGRSPGTVPCRSVAGWFTPECYTAALTRLPADRGLLLWLLVGASLLLLGGAALVVAWSRDIRITVSTWQKPFSGLYALSCAAVLGGALWWVASVPPGAADDAGRRGFAGTATAALVILGLLTILALVGCTIRRWVPAWAAVPLLVISTLGLLYWAAVDTGFGSLLVPAVSVAILAGIMAARGRGDYAQQAWAGAGPGVFMFLSLFGAAFLASALPVGFAWFLDTAATTRNPVETDAYWSEVVVAGTEAVRATVPKAFETIGGMQALFVTAILVITLTVLALRRRGRSGIGAPPVIETEPSLKAAILRRRSLSAIAHRAEPILGVVTAGVWAAVTLALLASATARDSGLGQQWLAVLAGDLADSLPNWGLLLGGALLLLEAIRSAASHGGRPAGLLWDLMCWLPRAAHPFGPSCYAERAVPEIGDRIAAWLEGGSRRRVLLSTHSLGTVLAVCSLFELCTRGQADLLRRVQILSYGIQLRPYFGRLFPELLGPAEIGLQATRMPSLFAGDPWGRQMVDDGSADPRSVPSGTLLGLLGDVSEPGGHRAWVSLWRRTDYLGFPADSYAAPCEDGQVRGRTAVDSYVGELEPLSYLARVATHGNYLATDAYGKARRMLLASPPAQDPTGAG